MSAAYRCPGGGGDPSVAPAVYNGQRDGVTSSSKAEPPT